MVNVCVPTIKRYDLLVELLTSLAKGTLQPDAVYVINNGQDEKLHGMVRGIISPTKILTPKNPMGVAESWNWFIRNVPMDRVICNDDLLFAPESLERIADTPGGFVSALAGTNACSCFMIRDSCVRKVGYFDERISPGYAYFEDCDYGKRLQIAGVPITPVECGVVHLGSQTLRANTPEEWQEHHRRFKIARDNYFIKWGEVPHGMEDVLEVRAARS